MSNIIITRFVKRYCDFRDAERATAILNYVFRQHRSRFVDRMSAIIIPGLCTDKVDVILYGYDEMFLKIMKNILKNALKEEKKHRKQQGFW
jgi:hypothetical protein